MIKQNLSFLLLAFLTAGCSTSLIKIETGKDSDPYAMFGKIPQREFYVNEEISDSVKLKWETEINGSFPNSSVTIFSEYVFVNDLSGRVYCFNITTGKEVGKLKLKGAVYTTPVLINYTAIFINAFGDENKSILHYYNFLDGRSLNEIEIRGKVVTELIKTDDGILFTTENGIVYRYNLFGTEIWHMETNAFTHSSPSFMNDKIIFGNDKGEIIAINYSDGKILYRKKIGKTFFGGSSISNNIAFIGDDSGVLFAIDISTGAIKWQYNSGARITMIPVVGKNDIYIGNLSGNLFSLNKETGKLNWKSILNGVLNSTPLVTKNYIVVPNLFEKLDFVKTETGEITRSILLDGRGKLSPVFYRNLLFIGYDNGILNAYEIIK